MPALVAPRYDGSKHGVQGYWILAIANLVTLFDLAKFFRRAINYVRDNSHYGLKSFWTQVIGGREVLHGSEHEYSELVAHESEDLQYSPTRMSSEPSSPIKEEDSRTVQWATDAANRRGHHRRNLSVHSDRTLLGHASLNSDGEVPKYRVTAETRKAFGWRLAGTMVSVLERVLVFAGFVQVLSGVVVYTGGCRVSYLNGCLAHLISA